MTNKDFSVFYSFNDAITELTNVAFFTLQNWRLCVRVLYVCVYKRLQALSIATAEMATVHHL